MRREHRLARILRAVSGKTQEQLAEETGVHRSVVAQIELGEVLPSRDHLEAMAESARITLPDAERILQMYETLRVSRRRWGRDAGELLDRMTDKLRSQAGAAYQRLLTLSLPPGPSAAWALERAEELYSRLAGLSEEMRRGVVRVAEEYQTWYLCERVCLASEQGASRDVESAASWAALAQEIADRVTGPEEFRSRVQGYALGHVANVLRVSGDLRQADATFERAKRLWQAGSDPGRVLDSGRLLDLEASLRKDQRRLDEALVLLDEAAAVSRFPGRVLIKKAITLEKMDEPERAVETLLQAEPLIERQGDARLLYMLRFNLAVNYCHVGRYAAAAELLDQVREVATQRGDESEVIRVTWLQGRIAAGLGQPLEARSLLARARRAFELRGKSYDVALALLEEAILLLDEGRASEVRALAGGLTRIFEEKGVHREALAALRLFYEAAEREEITSELARRVLRFLARARDDQSLRFES